MQLSPLHPMIFGPMRGLPRRDTVPLVTPSLTLGLSGREMDALQHVEFCHERGFHRPSLLRR